MIRCCNVGFRPSYLIQPAEKLCPKAVTANSDPGTELDDDGQWGCERTGRPRAARGPKARAEPIDGLSAARDAADGGPDGKAAVRARGQGERSAERDPRRRFRANECTRTSGRARLPSGQSSRSASGAARPSAPGHRARHPKRRTPKPRGDRDWIPARSGSGARGAWTRRRAGRAQPDLCRVCCFIFSTTSDETVASLRTKDRPAGSADRATRRAARRTRGRDSDRSADRRFDRKP